jgi:hypothetical protein
VNACQKLYEDENKEDKRARKYEAAEAASNSAKKRKKTAAEDDKLDIESFMFSSHQRSILKLQTDWFKDRYERCIRGRYTK